MATHTFYQLDVFTERPLAGNALAVFPRAEGLDGGTMQALAREMNLSETVFVTASAAATRRVRFFTPAAEIPLAGHPTIGTWWLLAELGEIEQLPSSGTVRATQETDAGVLPVDIRVDGGRPVNVSMTQPLPDFSAPFGDRARLGDALGGDASTVGEPEAQVVATALPQLMVPIVSLAALQALPVGGTGGQLATLLRSLGTDCAMCYVRDPADDAATVQCRMFAPGLGVPEDPGTGSAAGALGCYLVKHGLVAPDDGVAHIVVDQGLEIGRPCRIHVDIHVSEGGEITDVKVGGRAVSIIKGEVTL